MVWLPARRNYTRRCDRGFLQVQPEGWIEGRSDIGNEWSRGQSSSRSSWNFRRTDPWIGRNHCIDRNLEEIEDGFWMRGRDGMGP